MRRKVQVNFIDDLEIYTEKFTNIYLDTLPKIEFLSETSIPNIKYQLRLLGTSTYPRQMRH